MSMTMNFDMNNNTLGNTVSTGGNGLSGNKIHDVVFKGVDYSLSKDGNWEFMNIKFQGENGGMFTHREFGLKSDANERKKSQFGENPSQYESFMMLVKHLLQAVAPEVLTKMSNGEIVFSPTKAGGTPFKQYTEFIARLMEEYIDTPTQIKLILNNKGEARFPSFPVSLSREGQVYMKTNFIGMGLKFTEKEMVAIKVSETAKPTVMPAVSTDNSLSDLGDASEEESVESKLMDLKF